VAAATRNGNFSSENGSPRGAVGAGQIEKETKRAEASRTENRASWVHEN